MFQISKMTRMRILKLFTQISSSRQSLISTADQRSLYKRINFLGLSVMCETSNLESREVQEELIFYMKRIFYIYGELVLKHNKSYAEIVWRTITRVVLYVMAQNSVYFDEKIIHKTWTFLNIIKRRKMEKHLTNTTAENLTSAQSNDPPVNYLYSSTEMMSSDQSHLSETNNMSVENFVQIFTQIPAAFLCNIEYLNSGNPVQSFQESLKLKRCGYYSDLVLFYYYLCFFQNSANTQSFEPNEAILQNLMFTLKSSLQFYRRFFLSRFKQSPHLNQQAKLQYYSGSPNQTGGTSRFPTKASSTNSS